MQRKGHLFREKQCLQFLHAEIKIKKVMKLNEFVSMCQHIFFTICLNVTWIIFKDLVVINSFLDLQETFQVLAPLIDNFTQLSLHKGRLTSFFFQHIYFNMMSSFNFNRNSYLDNYNVGKICSLDSHSQSSLVY